MPRTLKCTQCGKPMQLPDGFGGPLVKCPHCEATIEVGRDQAAPPQVQPAIQACNCPACSQPFGVLLEAVGRGIRCPHCQAELSVSSGPGGLALSGATAGGVDDPLAFLQPTSAERAAMAARAQPPQAPPGSAPPGPLPPAAPGGHGSRYRAGAAGATGKAELVLREFYCEDRAILGNKLTKEVHDVLKGEACYESILITDDPTVRGTKATLDDGLVSVSEVGASFGQRAFSSVMASATLLTGTDRERELSFQSRQQAGNVQKMTDKNLRMLGKKFAREVLKDTVGYSHTRAEVNNLATTSCVLACLAIVPYVGFGLYATALVLATMAWAFNSGRADKVGITRVPLGLAWGLIAIIYWWTGIQS